MRLLGPNTIGLVNLTDNIVLSATGALLIIGIGLTLLDLKKIRLANFLPALILSPIFVAILAALNVSGFQVVAR